MTNLKTKVHPCYFFSFAGVSNSFVDISGFMKILNANKSFPCVVPKNIIVVSCLSSNRYTQIMLFLSSFWL